MDLGIAGKVALVVGGTLGIGRECSLGLAREGVRVVPVSRNQNNVNAIVELICGEGGEAAGVAADCLTKEGIAKAVEGARAHFGPPDIAIYIPFATINGKFDEIDDDDMIAGDNALVRQFLNMARLVIPHMKEQRWGRIVTIGTNSVRRVHRQFPLFVPNVYRMAASGLQKTLSDEMAPYGITVNMVGPGATGTDNFNASMGVYADYSGITFDEVIAERCRTIPMKRIAKPEEVAAACLFFCSQGAAFITGENLMVDGGETENLV